MFFVKICVILTGSKHNETKLFLDIILILHLFLATTRLREIAVSASFIHLKPCAKHLQREQIHFLACVVSRNGNLSTYTPNFIQFLGLTRVGPRHQMRFHKPYLAILEFDPGSRRFPPPCHRTGMSLWYSLNGRLIQQDRRRIYRSAGASVSPFKSGPHGLPEWF